MRQSLEILNVFNTLNLSLLKNENLFQKLENPYLIESITIENATFPSKTALSKASVKTNRTGSIKWTYQKEKSFTTNYLSF